MSGRQQTQKQGPAALLVTNCYRNGRLRWKLVQYETPTINVVEKNSPEAGHFGAVAAVLIVVGIGIGYFLNALAIASA